MTNAETKAKWMPGKERPAASRLGIQKPPTTEPHHRNTGKDTKPSAGQPIGQTAEGLDHRFLRSQPRVIGPGSLCKARPRQSDYNTNTFILKKAISSRLHGRQRADEVRWG